MTSAIQYKEEKELYSRHNLCIRCHQDESREGRLYCALCLAKWSAYHKRNREKRNQRTREIKKIGEYR